MENIREYNIRLEEPADWQEVENLTREAFWNVYRPGCLEHFVLNRYRSNPDFIPELDFVMEQNGKIIGLKTEFFRCFEVRVVAFVEICENNVVRSAFVRAGYTRKRIFRACKY